MKKRFLMMALLVVHLLAHATDYYFSAAGNDGNAGTSTGSPWQTLSKFNSFFSSFQPGDHIYFRRGDTFNGTMVISRSGSAGNPVSMGAYGSGNDPIISGLTAVSGWTSSGTNLWTSTSAVSTLTTLNMVTINDAFQAIGRYPKVTDTRKGYKLFQSHSGNTSITSNEINGVASFVGGEVVIRKVHWILDRGTVTGQTSTTVTYSNGGSYNPSDNYGFFFQNHVNACTANGDWAYSSSTKKITMYNTSSPTGVKVSGVDILVTISGRTYINFDDIVFSGCNSHLFSINSSNHINFNACTFQFAGIDGINTNSSSNNINITNCTGSWINNNCFTIRGAASCTLTGNTLTDIGSVAGMGSSGDGNYFGVWGLGDNCLAQYNVLRRIGYIGIDFRGGAVSILNNFLDSCTLVKDDGAAIYAFTGPSAQTYSQRIVDHNIVLRSVGVPEGTNTPNSSGYGIYMDDNASQVTVTNNTVAHCGGSGIYLHADHGLNVSNNNVYNNVSASGYGGQLLAKQESSELFRTVTFKNNKLVSRTSAEIVAYYISPASSPDFNQFGTFDSNYYARPINDNTTIHVDKTGGNQNLTLAGWQSLSGMDAHSKKSPVAITDVNDLRFEYNATNSTVGISLGGNTYIDMAGTAYSGTLNLPAWSSITLIKTAGGGNNLPVVTAGPDQTITLPTSSVTMAGNASDPDGTISSHTWTKLSGPAATITTPSSYTTTITGLTQGVYQFQLSATDNSGGTNTDVMQVTVNAAANIPPTANAGTDKNITLPTNTTTLNGSGNDPDGTITAYLWAQVSGPAGATIVSSSQQNTVINNLNTAGTYIFRLRVTDNNGATATDDVNVVVSAPANQPPVANAGADQTITQPASSSIFAGSATDADGSVASHAWSFLSGPIVPTITTPSSYTSTVTGMTLIGSYIFLLTAIDNLGATGTDGMTILVNGAANQTPTANAGADKNITLPTNTVTLAGSGNDPDGTIVGYLWSKISGPASSTIVSPSQATTVVNNLTQGTYVFRLRVTDNNGATNTDDVNVVVNATANQPPVVTAGSDQAITQPASSSAFAGNATDPDGTISSHTWSFISGPATPTITTPSSYTGTVTGMTVAGSYTFELSATDNGGATSTDRMVIQVNAAPNQAPSADAGADQVDTLPLTSINLSGSGTDPDGTIVAYLWTQVSGPNTANIVSSPQRNTAVTNVFAGVYIFRLRVTDNNGATAADSVRVTILDEPSPQPTAPAANAGPDKKAVICLFCSGASVSVTGIGTEGTYPIVGYEWAKVSGPSQYNIVSPGSASTTISNLVRGTYVFQFTVTDENDASATDTMTVIVTKNHIVIRRGKIIIQDY